MPFPASPITGTRTRDPTVAMLPRSADGTVPRTVSSLYMHMLKKLAVTVRPACTVTDFGRYG